MREMVEWARDCGVPVEGGWLCSAEDEASEGARAEAAVWPTAAEAAALVQRSGLDVFSLDAPCCGARTKIDFPRLKLINAAVNAPLALHGAVGLSEDQIRRVIFKGVAKIGVSVPIDDVARAVLGRRSSSNEVSFLHAFQDEISIEAERHMRLYGSAGRAAEVLSRCQHWAVVQQIWLCADDALSEQEFTNLVSECRQLAGTRPGVRGVFAGRALTKQDKYCYCVVVRLSHPQVLNDAHQAEAAISVLHRSFNERCLAVGVQAFETVA